MASRLNASYISILQRFCDVLAIYLGFYFIYKLNAFDFDQQALTMFLIVVSIFQLIGGLTDFYRSWRGVSLFDELIFCSKNVLLSVCLSSFILLFLKNITVEILFNYFVSVLMIMAALRVAIRLIYGIFYKISHKSTNVLIFGDGVKAQKLYEDLKRSEWIGFNPIGMFSLENGTDPTIHSGNLIEGKNLVQEKNIDKIYIIINQKNIKQANELIEFLSDTTCSTIIVPELFNQEFLYSRVEDINGTPIIPIIDTRLNGVNTFIKRIEDICFSAMILVLISPILFTIAIAIKITSKGPVFFKQTRYGLNGKPILVYKFRSMNVMENGAKVTQAVKNDPRLTPIGGFLRRTSIDELPQFINVFLGSMSVVGPRPHAVAHNEEYRKLIPGYMLRHKVKPGITGLAQIRGWRGETDTLDKMEKRVECDLEYIRTWSIWLDVQIIFLTVFKGFIHKAAY